MAELIFELNTRLALSPGVPSSPGSCTSFLQMPDFWGHCRVWYDSGMRRRPSLSPDLLECIPKRVPRMRPPPLFPEWEGRKEAEAG